MFKNEFKRAPPLILETTQPLSLADQFRRQSDPNYIPRKDIRKIKVKPKKSAFKKPRAKQGRIIFPNKNVKEAPVSSLGAGYIASLKVKKEAEKFIEPRDEERDRRQNQDNLSREELKQELKQSSLILDQKIKRRIAQQDLKINQQISQALSQSGTRSVVDDFKSFVDIVDRLSGVQSAPTQFGASSRGSNLGMPEQPVIVSSFASSPEEYIQNYYNGDKSEFLRDYPDNLSQIRDLKNLKKVSAQTYNTLTAEAQQYAKANQKPPVDVGSLKSSRAFVSKQDISPERAEELFREYTEQFKKPLSPREPASEVDPEIEKKAQRDFQRIQKGLGTKTFYSRSTDTDPSRASGDTDLENADASRISKSITGGRKGLDRAFEELERIQRGGLADPPVNKGDLADKVERAVLNENAQGQSKVKYAESKSSRHSRSSGKTQYSIDSRRKEIFDKDGGRLKFNSLNNFNTGDNISYNYKEGGQSQQGVGRLTGFYQLAEERLGQVRAEITFKDGRKHYIPMAQITKKSMKKLSDSQLVKEQTRGKESEEKATLRARLTPDPETSSKKSLTGASFKSDSITEEKLSNETEKIMKALGGTLTETQKETLQTLGDMSTNDPEIRERLRRQREIKKSIADPTELYQTGSDISSEESQSGATSGSTESTTESEKFRRREEGTGGFLGGGNPFSPPETLAGSSTARSTPSFGGSQLSAITEEEGVSGGLYSGESQFSGLRTSDAEDPTGGLGAGVGLEEASD